ncbi:MAG: hypothetical protein ACLUQ6_00080 [Alistipes onderdonkii]
MKPNLPGKALVLSVDENETGTERSTVVNVTRSNKEHRFWRP